MHSPQVLVRHATWEALVRTGQTNIQAARRAQSSMLRAAAASDPTDAELPMKIVILDNNIMKGDYELAKYTSIEMSDSENMMYGNDWRTYRDLNSCLEKHRDQTYFLILGQCMQLLEYKMKQDTAWHTTNTSYNTLTLIELIENTTLMQKEDQYLFATVYAQKLTFYMLRQVSMSNSQWYKRFNTKVDISESISMTHRHKALLEYVAQ